jgi:hypothetical protein
MKGHPVIDVRMIGLDREINWNQNKDGLTIGFPDTTYTKWPYNTGFTFSIQLDMAREKIKLSEIEIGNIQLSKKKVNAGESFTASVILINNSDLSGLVTIGLLIDGELFGSVHEFAEAGIGHRKIGKKVSLPVVLYAAGKHKVSLQVGESVTEGAFVQINAPELPY